MDRLEFQSRSLNLVFFRIQILLFTGIPTFLTQLEAAVYDPLDRA